MFRSLFVARRPRSSVPFLVPLARLLGRSRWLDLLAAASAPLTCVLLIGCAQHVARPLSPESEIERQRQRTAQAFAQAEAHSATAAPQPADAWELRTTRGWTEADLVAEALRFHRNPRTARADLRDAAEGSFFGRLRLKPELRASVTAISAGISTDSEALYQWLTPAGARLRQDLERSVSAAEEARQREEELHLAAEVRLGLLAVRVADALCGLASDVQGQLAGFRSDGLADHDATALRLAQQQAEAARAAAGTRAAAARRALARFLGLDPGTVLPLADDGRPLAPPETSPRSQAELDAALIARHPELQRAQAAWLGADAGLRQEIVRQYPRLTLGPTLHMTPQGATSFSISAGVRIPLPGQTDERIAAAQTARDHAEHRYALQLADLRAAAHAAEAALRAGLSELSASEHAVASHRAAARDAYAAGRIDLHALLAAVRACHDAERSRIDLLARTWEAAIRRDELLAP